jgi:hypothetical protein
MAAPHEQAYQLTGFVSSNPSGHPDKNPAHSRILPIPQQKPYGPEVSAEH